MNKGEKFAETIFKEFQNKGYPDFHYRNAKSIYCHPHGTLGKSAVARGNIEKINGKYTAWEASLNRDWSDKQRTLIHDRNTDFDFVKEYPTGSLKRFKFTTNVYEKISNTYYQRAIAETSFYSNPLITDEETEKGITTKTQKAKHDLERILSACKNTKDYIQEQQTRLMRLNSILPDSGFKATGGSRIMLSGVLEESDLNLIYEPAKGPNQRYPTMKFSASWPRCYDPEFSVRVTPITRMNDMIPALDLQINKLKPVINKVA